MIISGEILKKQIFELRFFPIATFFDRRSELLDLLYYEQKTRKKTFEHWQLSPDKIRLFDQDGDRSFLASFQNCAFSVTNPPTYNYARDQILKYVGETIDFFGDKIDSVLRFGFREVVVTPVREFDELSQLLVQNFVRTDSSFFQSLGSPVYDLTLFPMIFRHGSNQYQITVGPTSREQLFGLWGEALDLPEQSLYLDVDYYSLTPKITGELRTHVAEFLTKAREINSKISLDISENILAKLK
jgi:hypothetical protein